MKIAMHRKWSEDKSSYRDDVVIVFEARDADFTSLIVGDSIPTDTGLVGTGEFEFRMTDKGSDYYLILKGEQKDAI